MNKILLIILIILLTISILTLAQDQLQENYKPINISSFTKAVCENNFCQDYLFKCQDKKIKSINPITGAAVQFDKDWEDPRTKEQIEKTC